MGIMEEHLLNTTSTMSSHQLRDLWKSPRGTVLRIQALAMVAIIFSFFLAAYGSCRRWSNSWIVQKGFFAAQVLSLSLGTYSIGLMQSSSVKSEMYPIWTVSLFTLFGCIDPVTAYNGLDYKGQLSQLVFGICLHCGYVLLMSISTISTVIGNTAIGMLSAITFIKGFHRSLSLVQQSRMRNKVQNLQDSHGHGYVFRKDPRDPRTINLECMIVKFATGIDGSRDRVILSQVEDALSCLEPKGNEDEWPRCRQVKNALSSLGSKGVKDEWLRSCYDLCVAMSLSHHLQRHVLGLGYRKPLPERLKGTNYKWALKVIEIELALVYDYFYTGNPFIQYYQAKTASLWALVSFIGICFVGVAAAIPGTMSSRRHTTSGSGAGACPSVVNTTTADLVVTFVILVFLALLQLMHLIRSWTSNWARVAVASTYATNIQKIIMSRGTWWWLRWMRLKAYVATSSNWFDKYLWQDKIGQYSVLPEGRLTVGKKGDGNSSGKECKSPVSSSATSMTAGQNGEGGSSSRKECKSLVKRLASMVGFLYRKCACLVTMLGLDYIWEVLWDLLGSDSNKRPAVRLDDDVKESIVKFLCQIETDRLDANWLSFSNKHPSIGTRFIPSPEAEAQAEPHGYRYTWCVMKLHTVTWYCELKEQEFGVTREENQNRRVANALSKYCAYLVESAPELLPGPAPETKRAYNSFKIAVARMVLVKDKDSKWFFFGRRKKNKDRFLGGPVSSDPEITWKNRRWMDAQNMDPRFVDALAMAEELMGEDDDGSRHSDLWGTLVLAWVRLLVYAAPYGNVEMHMRRLSQGGEFITHLWTLLYHLDIHEWKASPSNLKSITTMDDAEVILADNNTAYAVVAYINSPMRQGFYSDEFANASMFEREVDFYETSSADVAKLFHIDPAAGDKALILLNRQEQKFTLYDGEFRAYDIAYFVSLDIVMAKDTRQCHQETELGGWRSEDQISADEAN